MVASIVTKEKEKETLNDVGYYWRLALTQDWLSQLLHPELLPSAIWVQLLCSGVDAFYEHCVH